MLLGEPPPSQGDIHFRLIGMPVRIHPFFWVTTLILGMGTGSTPPAVVFSWIVAVLFSILVHEMGHAAVQRRYGGHPKIVLYGLGGLSICDDCDRSSAAQIFISLAGPGAGFLFAAALLLLVRAVGHQAGCVLLGELPLERLGLLQARVMDILGAKFYWKPFVSPHVDRMIGNLLYINLLWGAVNLLPIYPLDGGRISREICLTGNPRRGMVLSMRISLAFAALMAVVGLSWGSWFVALFFGYLAYTSYRTLQAYQASLW